MTSHASVSIKDALPEQSPVRLPFSALVVVTILVSCVIVPGCSSTEAENTTWQHTERGQISFKVPPEWKIVQDRSRSTVFTHSGTVFNVIHIQHHASGSKFEHLNRDVSGIDDVWELAELELMNLKSNPDVVDVTLHKQKPFEPLGTFGYMMKLTVHRSNGFQYRYWMIGSRRNNRYARITLAAEQSLQFPRHKETFRTFVNRLSYQK